VRKLSFPALGTTAVLVVADPALAAHASLLLRAHIDRVDRACSRFRADSELVAVNRRSGEVVELSADLHGYVRAALDAANATDGLVDPTLGAELRGVGYDRTFALVAARDGWRVREVARRPERWRSVELDDERRLLRVPAGAELDLGATAKARAADLAAREIAACTGGGTLVGLGGDIAVAGEPPTGGWPVLVAERHDATLDGPGERVSLVAGGLATSSITVRRWTTDRGPMHHVLDPRTGMPVDGRWRSVTVAATTCLDANVASTAALVLGDTARPWLERLGVHARLVSLNGTIVATHSWPVDLERAA
jgi:thiamine biosynthesis lipoprotein